MGFFDDRELRRYEKEADKVLSFEKTMASLSDEELRDKTPYFKDLLAHGKTLDDIKYEAFAVVREAAKRTIGEFPFKVQIIGGLVLHDGNIAEMKTGEGKTLTATMPVYLNALAGKGVYIVTVNEYLSQRDAEWMGQIYKFLGLTVGCNIRELTTSEKQAAYNCDITYTTNSELGFDYLRDNMVTDAKKRVLRGLEFVIVDEADSILIDESRTPLIISGGAKASPSQYTVADRFVKTLRKEVDYTVDVKEKTVNLTDSGNQKAERAFGIPNLYDPQYSDLVHRIQNALKANYIMFRDVDYLVDKDNQVQIIDQFTGRVLPGREWSDGVHQAVQAKENVPIKQETVTMATITYQNFFRLFKKLAGMTGTAKTEEEEFNTIYNMHVVCVPTNMPVIREDALDYVYARKAPKLAALIKEVKERHEKGQPILIGTVSVESSEEISALLTEAGLPHEMLNAKNHAREAEIIAHAGEKGHITLATNMAGRGTDIKINDEVRALGGLCVFGTERHESRRIDNQLRGRAGRQGDPGFSRFYVSFEDTLLVRFAADNMKQYIEKNFGDDPLEAKMVSNVITGAQKRIEGQNFDTRKALLDYDDVLAKQRQIVYDRRDTIILGENMDEIVDDIFRLTGEFLADKAVPIGSQSNTVSSELLIKTVEPRFLEAGTLDPKLFEDFPADEVGADLGDIIYARYLRLKKTWPADVADEVERSLILRCLDNNWTKHIDTMSRLREAIHLRSYANVNPLQDYVNEGAELFRECLSLSAVDAVLNLVNVKITPVEQPDSPEGGENTANTAPNGASNTNGEGK
ncbi:MAG: preprotein translocase subunit SecA [Coprobacillus sp.]|nr:preprotein translocase subunit SecA [Coprobacillus sp.]